MANVLTQAADGTRKWVLDTTAVINLGDAMAERASSWIIHTVQTGAAGSFIPKNRVIGSGLTGTDIKACSYFLKSAHTTVVAAGTAVTTEDIVIIPSDGCDTFLDYTQDTGSLTIYVRAAVGV